MSLAVILEECKDSAHNIQNGIDGYPAKTNPKDATASSIQFELDLTPATDIVTNDERAKSPDLLRVLSPMRQRRTPKLVNAPDVRWRLAPHLRHMLSFDSVLSTATETSGGSTVRPPSVAPHNIALPESTRSSLFTVTPVQNDPRAIPLPPSPPRTSPPASKPAPPPPSREALRLDTSNFNEALERQKLDQRFYISQPHLLSPVTEVSSITSMLSSSDFDAEITTAERHSINGLGRQDLRVVNASQASLASQQSRQSRFRERINADGVEHHEGQNSSAAVQGANEGAEQEGNAHKKEVDENRGARTLCAQLKKLSQRVRKLGQTFEDRLTRKLSVWIMAKELEGERL